MSRFQVHLIWEEDYCADLVERLRKSGATGICVPVERTRTSLQSLADSANRAGLGVFAWIDLRPSEDPDQLRRLVEAYPYLDGYFVRGLPFGGRSDLPGANLIPVFDHDAFPISQNTGPIALLLASNAAIRVGSALEATIAVYTTRDPLLELTAVIEDPGLGALALLLITARVESAGARGVVFSSIPFDELNRKPHFE